jgi:alkylation response protein AidB-like acyl-CoA dehydrogenase
VIDKDTPGLSFGPNERKMGCNAQPTAQVIFEDCRVSAANRVGAEGDGFKFAMAGLDGGRINIGACSLGGAAAALRLATDYAKERKQFGKAISEFQNTQFRLADMATELEASRLMIYRGADAIDNRVPNAGTYCAMGKRFATDLCSKIANDALQVHGGYGYLADYQVERIVRDLRVHQILEGTNDIMRVIISRGMLRQ